MEINSFSPLKKVRVNREAKVEGDKKVSIIIPVFNQIAFTKNCIESIKRYTKVNYEIIIVDNGSVDNSTEELMKFQEDIDLIIIRNDRNLGFGQANNQGAKLATGEFLLFLNNDTEVLRTDWLKKLLSEAKKGVGLVGGSGGLLGIDDENKSLNHRYATLKGTYNYIEGWCMLIRRELFEVIGGFDKDFGMALGEDADLSFKVRDKGLNIRVAEGFGGRYIRHYGSRTLRAQEDFDIGEMGRRNSRVLYEKWRERGRNKGYLEEALKTEGSPLKILLVRNSAIGDVLMTTALFPAIKEAYPNCEIHFKTNPLCHHLLLENPYLTYIFLDDKVPEDYDLTFNLRYEDEPQTNAVDVMAKTCGVGLKNKKPYIYLTEEEVKFAEGLLDESQKYVIFHTGRTWKSRECDIEVFKKAKDYVRSLGYKTIEVGRTDTISIGADIDLRGKTTIRQTASIVSRCKMFIGLDSAVAHIAKAFDLPCITLYGYVVNPEVRDNGSYRYPVIITEDVDILLGRIIGRIKQVFNERWGEIIVRPDPVRGVESALSNLQE